MFRARSLFVAALVVCLVPAVSFAVETERVHKVVPLGPGGTLKLNNFSGEIRITGADVSQVTIDAVRRAEQEQLDHIKLDISVSGSTVTVEANKKDDGWEKRDKNVVETDFVIQVPRQTTLDVHGFSSPVIVSGVSGAQTINTFSGRVDVQDSAAGTRVKTFSGPVNLRFGADVATADGDVETFSGRIDLKLNDGVRGKVEFNTFSGDMTSDFPLTLQRQSRRHLIGELGGGGGSQLQLRTFSGDVAITK